jgi:hypothetical protein
MTADNPKKKGHPAQLGGDGMTLLNTQENRMSRTQGTCTTTGPPTERLAVGPAVVEAHPSRLDDDPEYAALAAESERTCKSIVRIIGERVQDEAIHAEMVAEDAVEEQISELGLEEWEYWVFESAVERVVDAGGPDSCDVAAIVANEVACRQAFAEFSEDVLSKFPQGSDWHALSGGLLASAAFGGRLPGVSVDDARQLVAEFPTIPMPSGGHYDIAAGEFVPGGNPSPSGPSTITPAVPE